MKKIAVLLALLFASQAHAADNTFPTPGNATANGAVNMCLNGGGQAVPCSSAAPLAVSAASASQLPSGATAITASAVGTTAATTATLAGTAGKTTYLCGFSIRANATAAATGNATVTGTITGTLNFTQWTAPLASGLGVTEPNIGPSCIPAGAANTGIAVVSAAPGAGGVISVTAWGYQL